MGWTKYFRLPFALLLILLLSVSAAALETQAGDEMADSLREQTGSAIAMITDASVQDSFSAGFVKTEVSPADIFQILETSADAVSVDSVAEQITDATDRWISVSGISVEYDFSAPPGERVLRVTLEDGTQLNPEDSSVQLVLAASADLAEGQLVSASVEVKDLESSDTPGERRIRMLGVHDNQIVNRFPRSILLAACGGAILISVFWSLKVNKRKPYTESKKGLYGGFAE